jgi:pyruvate dehydrogenase E1 component beta subunit
VTERVAENLNKALHGVMAADNRVFFLGEDIADPYGGAFRISRGLSTAFPDRTLSTPISEAGIVGAAAGLALYGLRPIVEIMFGDFIALAFDQLVNFSSKTVSMYGRRVPMNLIVRCPVGGNRGYGPTHSQSLQKHFLGVPGLALFEITQFHDNEALLHLMLERGDPCICFENKVLYTTRMYDGGRVDDIWVYEMIPSDSGHPPVARVFVDGVPPDDPVDCLFIVAGGMVPFALEAMRSLLLEHELICELVVPTQLFPIDFDGLLPRVRNASRSWVVEECVPGGTWGTEIVAAANANLWQEIEHPVALIHSEYQIIPAAPHLEREVLVQASTIVNAARASGVSRRVRPLT